ncbi:MAG: hypothetical protein AAF740_11540, partial [Bacteroidota bacterium]
MAYFFVGIGVSLTALFLWMGAKSASSKGLERYFWAGVTLKVLAGLILGWLYKSIYSGGDPWAYFEQSNHLTKLFFTDFSAYQEAFFRPSFNSLYGQSRQDYVVRWFSLIHLFGGSSFWLTSIYLSLLSFSGIWVLVCALIRQFPKAKKAVLWSFLFLPTMIFWSSSWTKESVLWCFLGWMVAILVSPKEKWRFWHLPLLLIAFFLIWKVKYYYLAALLPALLSWRIAKFFTTRLQVSAQLTIYGLILAGATQLHYNLQLNHLIKAIFDSHHYILENTSPQNIVLELPLEPSLWELVRNIPKALWGSFVAPFPPHSPLQVLAGTRDSVFDPFDP